MQTYSVYNVQNNAKCLTTTSKRLKLSVVLYQVDLREDEATMAALKAKGQSPITQKQGKWLARELG